MVSEYVNGFAYEEKNISLFNILLDWLDNGNNKKALSEAEKVLKKQPDFVCCKVLKSLALIRLNRESEALPILDSITNEGTTDEGALQAMNIAYRELQQGKNFHEIFRVCNITCCISFFSPQNLYALRKFYKA